METDDKKVTDRELVRRCQKGSHEAFDELVRRHQDRIFNAVYRFCGNYEDAGDITQRAFVNAFRKIGEFKGDAAFTTWMYRIAFNQSVSFRREEGRRRAHSLYTGEDREMVHEPSVQDDPTQQMQTEDTRRVVQQALGRLEDEERRIIILKDIENQSYEAIAEILEIPKGTVRSRLHRARMSLKELLKASIGT